LADIVHSKVLETPPKSFEDLIIEVHEKGICGQCGGCVNFCSASEIMAIKMQDDGPPVYVNKDNCLHCGICYLICPQIHILDNELRYRFNWKPPIGNWTKVVSAQARSEQIQEEATDGGVVTGILLYLLENNLIDGALVCKKIGPFQRESFFAKTRQDLIEAAGSKFDFSASTEKLGKYSTFTPTISGLKSLLDLDRTNIAVVGVPCQIHSIRKMQQLKILPAHIIKYTLGLFCYENFSFYDPVRVRLENKLGFSFSDILKMNIKENILFKLRDGRTLAVPFASLKEGMRTACSACDDFSNVYSDISFGGLGSEQGHTSTLIRTRIGENVYEQAVKKGYIQEDASLNTSIKKSEMLAKIISFSKMKMKRAKKRFNSITKFRL